MAISMTGKTGRMQAAGRDVAALADWETTAERGRVVIRAILRDVNTFRLGNSAVFDVLLDAGGSTKVYRGLPAHVIGERVTFVKQQEERHG